MRRIVEPELLDTDAGSPAEVANSLADLRTINRLFGGISTMRDMVARVMRTRSRHLTWLDVATGSGDVPHAVATEMKLRGAELGIVGLDRAITHFANANSFPRVVGDALALPFHDNSFDLVGCSLFLHHLEPEQIRRFAAEALRVCRVAVLFNDLRRSAIHLALVRLAVQFCRSRITRHDGPVSIRRAYTMDEMRLLLTAMPARLEIAPHFLYRFGAVLWKQ